MTFKIPGISDAWSKQQASVACSKRWGMPVVWNELEFVW